MQSTNPPVDKRTADKQPIDLLRNVEGHRTTVRRVRELLAGERDPSQVKAGDFFTAIEYVRDETDTELVLYSESRHDDAPDTATIRSLGDMGLWCIVAGWSERVGYSREKIARFDVEESLRFAQADDPVPELLELEAAKRRVKAFAAAHE